MGVSEAIRTCFSKSFSGRAPRSEYRFFVLFGVIATFAGSLIDYAAGGGITASLIKLVLFEPASAPGTEGTGVADGAGLSGVPSAPDPGARSRAGNPLWTIPLTALTATPDRPLFSASRRPPIVAAPGVAPPQKQEDPAPPPPERPSFTLVGTIVSPAASVAVLQGSNADAISRLRVGEENDGWRVQGIDLRSIVVEKGAQSVELDLPRPDKAPPDLPGPDKAPPEASSPNLPTGPQGQPSHAGLPPAGPSADARPRQNL